MLEVRRATADDYPDMSAMGQEIGLHHHQALPHLITPDAMSEAAFHGLLADSSYSVMLGVDNGEIVGYLIYKVVDVPADEYFYAQRNLYVQEISIYQRHQRKGYGEALMNHAVEAAKAQGVSRVTLRVWAFNQGAVAFYERLGFAAETIMMAREL